MQIECPSCAADNKIEFGENIVCYECKKSFSGHSFKKFKKPMISATAALFIGAYGTYQVDQYFFEVNRYPVNVEYELLDNCINSSRLKRSSFQHINKSRVCTCALEKTMEAISYSDFRKSDSGFLSRFRNNTASCY